MPLHRALLVARHLHLVHHLAGLDVADLEAKEVVDVDEAQRLLRVDREGPDRSAERPDAADDGMRARVGDGEDWRSQSRQIHVPAIGAVDRVVRAGVGHDFLQHVAAHGVDGVPVRSLEGRQVEDLPVRRERHAIGAALVLAHPDAARRLSDRTRRAAYCRDVDSPRLRAGGDALDVLGLAGRRPSRTWESVSRSGGRCPCRTRRDRCRRTRRSCGCRASRHRGSARSALATTTGGAPAAASAERQRAKQRNGRYLTCYFKFLRLSHRLFLSAYAIDSAGDGYEPIGELPR